MMENFRRMIRGWLGKVLIVIFALPFALFGVSSIFQSTGKQNYVAKVNGVKIEQYQLQNAVELRRQSLQQRFGENIPETMLDPEFLKPSVLDGLIDRELLIQSADDNNLQYSLDEIKLLIAKEPAFHEDGKFSSSRYEEILRRAGILPHTYPEEFRKDLVSNQIREGYAATTFVTDKELQAVKLLNNQTRDFKYVSIEPSLVKKKITVEDDELEEFYQQHQSEFEILEEVVIEYLELSKDQFVDKDSITEAELEKRFAEKTLQLESEQERQASHILIEINDERSKDEAKSQINELYKQLQAGADFAKLAEEHSDDTGSAEKGGDLGLAGKGIYVPEFEQALYELKIGEISAPVLTEFGYHIIKLTNIAPELPGFDDLKEELINELALEKAEQPYLDSLEELRNLAYESADLVEAATLLNKEIQVSEFFNRNGGAGLTANQDVLKVAFSDELLVEGRNSDVLELKEGHALVFRVKEHKPTSVKPLADVLDLVKERVLAEKSKQKVLQLGEELLAALQSGRDLKEQFASYELEWKQEQNIKRNAAGMPREIVTEVFKLPKPVAEADNSKPVTKGMQLANGGYALIQLDKVSVADDALKAEDDKQLKNMLASQKGVSEFQNYTAWLRESADIVKR